MTAKKTRQINKTVLFVLILAIVSSVGLPSAKAEENPSTGQEMKYAAFAGMDYGFFAQSSVPVNETLKRGYQLSFRSSITRYWPEWIGELGLGWFFNRIRSAGEINDMTRLTTTAFFLDISGRYRIDQNWQVGPVIDILVGNSNVTFSQVSSNENSLAIVGGVRGAYEFTFSPIQVRGYAQIMTDLTIADRQGWWFQLGAQIGLPVHLPFEF
ncbi:MAG: hypothetical protein AABZ55_05115 [Bdellovibrionota bacterium]